MFNQQTTGGGMEVYFDDLVLDGEPQDFAADPKWEGRGNHVEFADRVRPAAARLRLHARRTTPAARPGEIGGIIWRDEEPAYYADRVGPLTLDDELFASGTHRLHGGRLRQRRLARLVRRRRQEGQATPGARGAAARTCSAS